MATYSNVIKGLQLFLEVEGDAHNVAAEHDAIYAGGDSDDKLTDEQKEQLESWGWHPDEEVGGWRKFV